MGIVLGEGYCTIVGNFVFFFNDTATTEIYTLSLHDALPILQEMELGLADAFNRSHLKRSDNDGELAARVRTFETAFRMQFEDRKSTRLNSSHANISYAVFCLKKKKIQHKLHITHSQTSTHYI